jgi:hypothetical protein
MNRLQEIEARLAAIANEIEQRGAELTAEQLTAFETEVNNLKTERVGLMAAAEQRNNLLNSIAEGRSGGAVVRTFPSPSSPAVNRGTKPIRWIAWNIAAHLWHTPFAARLFPQSSARTLFPKPQKMAR